LLGARNGMTQAVAGMPGGAGRSEGRVAADQNTVGMSDAERSEARARERTWEEV